MVLAILLRTFSMSLPVILLFQQKTPEQTANEVQTFVIRWAPLVLAGALLIACISLMVIASNIGDISTSIYRLKDSIRDELAGINSKLAAIEKATKEQK